MNSPINDVSDTAFWIAYHRALETARDDALFKDPWAAALAGERGRRISEEMPTSAIVAWTVALRTRPRDHAHFEVLDVRRTPRGLAHIRRLRAARAVSGTLNIPPPLRTRAR